MEPATPGGRGTGAALTVLAMDAMMRGNAAEAEALFSQVRPRFAVLLDFRMERLHQGADAAT